jgi:hypothetical protein
MTDSRLRIIVIGSLIREPAGGHAWANLSYMHGLAALADDVYYIEDSDDYPTCYDPEIRAATSDPTSWIRANAERDVGAGRRHSLAARLGFNKGRWD